MRYPYVSYTDVGFSELADRVDLLSVEPNPRGGRTSSWKISNEYRPIAGMRYLIHIHYHESRFAGIWERVNNARGVNLTASEVAMPAPGAEM